MGAIRLIQKPQSGQITFSVPDEMRDETIIIEFRPVQDQERASLVEGSEQLFDQLPDPNPDLDWNTPNVKYSWTVLCWSNESGKRKRTYYNHLPNSQ